MTRILTSHLSHVELYLHNYVGAPKLIKIRGSLSLVINLRRDYTAHVRARFCSHVCLKIELKSVI